MHFLRDKLARLGRALIPAALALCALPAAAGAAPGDPQLSISPGAHDWGIVDVDHGYQQTGFNVQNIGDDWADVSVSIDGPDASAFWFDWNGCGGSLSPWSSCGLGIAFDPSEPREYEARLVVTSGETEFTASLRGTGGLRQVTATPQPVDFGKVTVGQTAARSVTLQNTGNLYFQSMVAIPVGGDVGAFRVAEDGCSMKVLAPSVSCKLKVLFAPYEADNAEATLAIIGDGMPTLISVRGEGVAPAPAAPAKPAAPSGGGAKPAKPKRSARVAFNWRRGLPAPFRNGRVDLGIARCVAAPSCDVRVRSWFVAEDADASTGDRRTSKPRTAKWRILGGRVARVRIPRGLTGTPKRLVIELRSKAAGQADGVQRLNIPLVEGYRRGGAVVASPSGR